MKRGRAGSYTSLKKLRSTLTEAQINKELDEITSAQQEAKEDNFGLLSLFRESHLRRPLMIACLFQLTQQFCGINAVFFYSTAIFNLTSPGISSYLSVAVSIVTVAVTLVSVFTIEKVGRKILSLVGIAGMLIAAILYTIAFRFTINGLALACTFLYDIFYSFSMGPIPFVILPEIFDTQGLSFCLSVYCFRFPKSHNTPLACSFV